MTPTDRAGQQSDRALSGTDRHQTRFAFAGIADDEAGLRRRDVHDDAVAVGVVRGGQHRDLIATNDDLEALAEHRQKVGMEGVG